MNISDLYNRKILIVVPHEDDEICMSGGLLASLDNSNTRIIFTTNGNYMCPSWHRYKEAVRSCKKLGIKPENLIFLGYTDSPYDSESHMYTTGGVWTDTFGNSTTSGDGKTDEYCFSKSGVHHEFTKENFTKDIKENILSYRPDVIIGTDLDFHPDHIMTSLCLEKAVGEILKEVKSYRPAVLKGFAYENAYHGPSDYNDPVIKPMSFNSDKDGCLISNPYYSRNTGISFELSREAYTRNLLKNRLYRSLLCHRSQVLAEKAFSIINPNVVLWSRDTGNLMNDATVEVSSGNKDYLNDFMLCDSGNILNGNKQRIAYDKGIWIPDKDDQEKSIDILFSAETFVYEMKIYNGLINSEYAKSLSVTIDGKEEIISNNSRILNYKIAKKVKHIVIRVLDDSISNGFSEIELLKEETAHESGSGNAFPDGSYSKTFNCFINGINVFFSKVYRKLFIPKR